MSSVSFLTLVICVFSFFFASLAKDFSILLIFSKNQLLVFLNPLFFFSFFLFFPVLYFIYLWSTLYYFLPLLALGLVSSFSSSSVCKLGYWFEIFLNVGIYSSRFPFECCLHCSHSFGMLYFCFHWPLKYFLTSFVQECV